MSSFEHHVKIVAPLRWHENSPVVRSVRIENNNRLLALVPEYNTPVLKCPNIICGVGAPNDSRPHRSLGERTPSEFACQIALKGDLPGSQIVGSLP